MDTNEQFLWAQRSISALFLRIALAIENEANVAFAVALRLRKWKR